MIAAFREVADAPVAPEDEGGQERLLDALSLLLHLYAAARRRGLFLSTVERLHAAIRLYRPDNAEALLAEAGAYTARLLDLMGD